MPTETRRRSSVESLLGVPLSPMPGAPTFGERVQDIPLSEIVPNPAQPRTEFNEETLQELANSIKVNGLLEPIILRPTKSSATMAQEGGNAFEIVAGERRYRAHKILGLDTVKAIVREVTDRDMRLLALLENLQREDLSVLDRAKGVVQLAEELGGVEEAADHLGMSRRNAFRLAKIGRASQALLDIIRTNGLDLVASELFVNLGKQADEKGVTDLFLKKAAIEAKDKSSLEVMSAAIFGGGEVVATQSHQPVGGKPSATMALTPTPYWTKMDKSGLTLEITKGKTLSAKEKQTFVSAAQKFFREAGAKKIDIRF